MAIDLRQSISGVLHELSWPIPGELEVKSKLEYISLLYFYVHTNSKWSNDMSASEVSVAAGSKIEELECL